MKGTAKILVVALIVCTVMPWLAHAVAWSPEAAEHEEKAAKGIKIAGDIVCLFQSGTVEVRKIIHVGDVLPVYRENRDRQAHPVGKVKILVFVRENYLKAEVVEGELMTGDVAKKGDVATLLISSGDNCQNPGK